MLPKGDLGKGKGDVLVSLWYLTILTLAQRPLVDIDSLFSFVQHRDLIYNKCQGLNSKHKQRVMRQRSCSLKESYSILIPFSQFTSNKSISDCMNSDSSSPGFLLFSFSASIYDTYYHLNLKSINVSVHSS